MFQNPFTRGSWQFVDFFFVLSGFVIAASYRDRLQGGFPIWRFLGLRLARIYPLHVFVLAVAVGLEIAGSVAVANGATMRPMFDAARDPYAIVTHLLLLQSFGLHDRLTWNGPSWSIGTEFWAYVLFAIVVATSLRRTANRWIVATVIVCPPILLRATVNGINVTFDWGLIRCAYGFAFGVLCWSAWLRFASAQRRSSAAGPRANYLRSPACAASSRSPDGLTGTCSGRRSLRSRC